MQRGKKGAKNQTASPYNLQKREVTPTNSLPNTREAEKLILQYTLSLSSLRSNISTCVGISYIPNSSLVLFRFFFLFYFILFCFGFFFGTRSLLFQGAVLSLLRLAVIVTDKRELAQTLRKVAQYF